MYIETNLLLLKGNEIIIENKHLESVVTVQ